MKKALILALLFSTSSFALNCMSERSTPEDSLKCNILGSKLKAEEIQPIEAIGVMMFADKTECNPAKETIKSLKMCTAIQKIKANVEVEAKHFPNMTSVMNCMTGNGLLGQKEMDGEALKACQNMQNILTEQNIAVYDLVKHLEKGFNDFDCKSFAVSDGMLFDFTGLLPFCNSVKKAFDDTEKELVKVKQDIADKKSQRENRFSDCQDINGFMYTCPEATYQIVQDEFSSELNNQVLRNLPASSGGIYGGQGIGVQFGIGNTGYEGGFDFVR